jgi:hypothetical protein
MDLAMPTLGEMSFRLHTKCLPFFCKGYGRPVELRILNRLIASVVEDASFEAQCIVECLWLERKVLTFRTLAPRIVSIEGGCWELIPIALHFQTRRMSCESGDDIRLIFLYARSDVLAEGAAHTAARRKYSAGVERIPLFGELNNTIVHVRDLETVRGFARCSCFVRDDFGNSPTITVLNRLATNNGKTFAQ